MSIVNRIRCDGIDILDTRDLRIEMTEAKYSASFTDRIADIKIDMTILPTHPYYDYIKERVFPEHPQQGPIRDRTSTFLAWDNDREIFHGRPISADCDIYHRLKVTCECDAKFLEDVPDIFSMVGLDDEAKKTKFGTAIRKIFRPYSASGSDLYGYNRHAGGARKIYLGSVDEELAAKEIDKPSNNSIYSNLKSWLEAVEGYAKVIPVEDHYELVISKSRGAVDTNFFVKYGENVTDYKIQRGAENFSTAIHAVGKVDDSVIIPGGTPEDGFQFWLDDEEQSSIIPGRVIRHLESAETYGEIMYHEEFDVKDVEGEDNRRQAATDKAIESLKKKMKRYETIDISVVDLRLLGYDNSMLPILGNSYDIDIPPFHNLSALPVEPLTKIEANLLNPAVNGKLTFGDKKNLLSGRNTTVFSTASAASVTAQSALRTANAAATPTQVAQAIEQSEGRVSDFIIERGTSNIWTWRKWYSGDAECWGASAFPIGADDMTRDGNIYYADSNVAFPTGLFASTPKDVQISPGNCTINGVETNNDFWVGKAFITDKTLCKYRVYRTSNSQEAVYMIDIHATGRWK